MQYDLSNFKLYSVGIVAEDKPKNTNDVLVYPNEKLPFRDGLVESNIETTIAEGVDRSGKPYQDKVSTDITLRCKWLNLGGSNRVTAPDVVKNERVFIYQYGTKNEYYWVSTGLDDGLRSKETILFRLANNTDKSDIEGSDGNSVWLELSTDKKAFTFHTSSADGEAFTYAIRIDTGNSNVVITDNVNNRIGLYSKQNKLEMINSLGTNVTIEEKDITFEAPENINIKCRNLNIDTETNDIQSNDTNIESDVKINGDSDIQGNIAHQGNLINDGKITSNDVTLGTHKHPDKNQPPIIGT